MATSPRRAAAPIIQLFRAVLKLHRERLPPPMRDLGDSYARAEFRSHLRGKTTQPQWRSFVAEWQTYVGTLRGEEQATANADQQLTSVLESLNPDQRKRLEELQEELKRRDGPAPPLQ
ncbi:Acetate non-utilizing protein 9, mitochondrial [Tetrabaena socialis]|uniref:Succinate dehydrogenase assembly factor 3 n=1 Tax=Tetrabaena socialis TaxID=47790 RepID=A0A2J7ZV37_9CHLO|nr:Acetate non-utilizing protein 9, mitochondrial [Tetrabaena socialis]|eukprot:PNH04119.1 Acetate non-utilizing protein 9, mitochondrial [Tetrabaena socialis]